MTISSTNRKAGPFVGNGVTTLFDFSFKVFKTSDVLVTFTDANGADQQLTLDSDYTVTLNSDQDNNPGGVVTYPRIVPPGHVLTSSERLTLTGDLAALQPTDLPDLSPWFPHVVEDAFDRTTILIQQLKEESSRAIKISVSDTALTPLPTAPNRVNELLGFDALGNVALYPLTSPIGGGDRTPFALVLGTDFNAGDTHVTLPRAPGANGNLEVHFDASPQDFTQWSVDGTSLTFSSPIPVGVTRIWGYIGTTLSTQIPPSRSVGDNQLTWGNILFRVVDSVSALAALDPAIYTRAFGTGYYQPGDGGGGPYSYSAATPQNTANGGTIIASTVPGATGCWLLDTTGMVSVKQFGAKGDDVAADTIPWQACMTWCYTNHKAMFLPVAKYFLTAKVSVPGPMTIIGEAISPPVTPTVQQAQPVVQIRSTVTNGYAIQCGGATYARGGHYENFRLYGGGIAQHGLYLQNQGWDFCIRNVTVEGFTGTGVMFDYLQDGTVTNLSIIDCGTENLYPSFKCINQCNIIKFNHLRVEISPFMMDLTNSSDFFFSGCHFEQSEYIDAGLTSLNRYSRYSTIVGSGCTDIQFDSSIIAVNSVQGVASHFGVNPNTIDYGVSFNGTNIRFSKCRFAMNGANRSSRYLNFNSSSSTSVTECTFEAVYTDVNAITLSGTTFVNNDVTWMDDGVSTLFYGIANSPGGSPSIVENNRLYCLNAGGATKTSGYLLNSQVGGSYLLVGYNQLSVTKYYKHHNASCVAKTWMQSQTIDLTGFSGTIDLEKYDINVQFKWTVASTVNSILNMCSGQRVKLYNASAGTVTVNQAGNIVLKGNVNAAMSSNGVLALEENGAGFLVETSRNF